MELAKEAGVKIVVKMSRTLNNLDDLVKKNNGKPTTSITQVKIEQSISEQPVNVTEP